MGDSIEQLELRVAILESKWDSFSIDYKEDFKKIEGHLNKIENYIAKDMEEKNKILQAIVEGQTEARHYASKEDVSDTNTRVRTMWILGAGIFTLLLLHLKGVI